MSRLLLPTADSLVRAVLVRSIEDRRARRDTEFVVPSARTLARQLLSRGGASVFVINDDVATTTLDISGGDTGAVR